MSGFFQSAEEHERVVASYPLNSRYSGHVIPCAGCGAFFRTTDWPPAICKDCREACNHPCPEYFDLGSCACTRRDGAT